jgi:beta-lactamase regulating signal transducer with metallopeptidase domain
MTLLLHLSLHGSFLFLFVWFLDRRWQRQISAESRRWWWVMVPISFLVFIPLPATFPSTSSSPAQTIEVKTPLTRVDLLTEKAVDDMRLKENHVGWWFWLAGALTYLLVMALQTGKVLRTWSGERLCTDSALLDLLEDCKQEAGITAPIGVVMTDRLSGPAILGWLRPRILLPRGLVSSLTRDQLRAVLFHELAHFRSLDVPLNWLFSLAAAVHWFNPLAHYASHAWARFREEAADELAMIWMKESSRASYGPALIRAIQQSQGTAPPFGALAISESIHHLKRRLVMIHHYRQKSPHRFVVGGILIILIAIFVARPVLADDTDPKTVAVAAMQDWLKEMDQGQYDQSWKDAAPEFQKAITTAQWTAASNSVRQPLGKCTSRILASALHQTEVPSPTGTQKGDFVVAQFNSSFDNLAYAIETVCFEKAPDGTWKAAGYYIKPKS